MKKWLVLVFCVLLFVGTSSSVLADDGQAVGPGQSIVIRSGEEFDGDLAVIGGSVELREGGRVNGDVAVLGGRAIIDGEVDGSLVVLGGTVELESHALVRDDFFTLGAAVSRDSLATVQGETVETFRGRVPRLPKIPAIETWRSGEPWTGEGWNATSQTGRFISFVLSTLAMIGLGILLVLLLPGPTETVEQTVAGGALPSLAVGILTFLVLLVLVPLLVIICIGIPVAILLLLGAVAAGILGWAATGILIGRRLLAAMSKEPQPVLAAIAGIALIEVLAEVPCLGWMLALIVSAIGLGAVVLTRFGTATYVPRQAEPAPLPPPSEPTTV
jgi:hypothetical protein